MHYIHERQTELKTLSVDFQRVLDNLIMESKTVVMTEEEQMDELKLYSRITQDGILSATLFNITLGAIMRKMEIKGIIGQKRVQVLDYAADIVVIARNRRKLQYFLMTL